MGSNTNSIAQYQGASAAELQEAAGVTRFLPSSTEWYQTINGLLIQGGLFGPVAGNTLTGNIPFNAGFPKQVLGIFLQPIGTTTAGAGTIYSAGANVVDLNNFQIANDAATPRSFYWWAIGV